MSVCVRLWYHPDRVVSTPHDVVDSAGWVNVAAKIAFD